MSNVKEIEIQNSINCQVWHLESGVYSYLYQLLDVCTVTQFNKLYYEHRKIHAVAKSRLKDHTPLSRKFTALSILLHIYSGTNAVGYLTHCFTLECPKAVLRSKGY